MILPLSNGGSALIDDEDAAKVAGFTWHKTRAPGTQVWYVRTNGHTRAKIGRCYLHRLVMGFPKEHVDHRSRNGLDNRKNNLRRATRSQNLANQARRRTNLSGFKGVSRTKEGRWRVRLGNKQLGESTDPKILHAIYVKAADQLYGEFARAA